MLIILTVLKTGGFACNKSSLDRCKTSAAYGSVKMCSNMARLLQLMVLLRCQATWQALLHEVPQSYSEFKMEANQETHFDHNQTSTLSHSSCQYSLSDP